MQMNWTEQQQRQLEQPAPFISACPPERIKPMNAWLPLASLEEMESVHYDALIIGSGAGGGAQLWRLSQNWKGKNRRIGMIEAGDLLLPSHIRNLPTITPINEYNFILSPAVAKPVIGMPGTIQVFALGGKSILWGIASVRMSPLDIASWSVSQSDMNIYYGIAEQLMHVTSSFTEGSPMNENILGRLQKGGFPDTIPLPMAVDLTQTRYGQIRSSGNYSSFNAIAAAQNSGTPVDIAINAQAIRLIWSEGDVKGVIVAGPEGKHRLLTARQYIVSCGAIQSPRLLLNSSIPNPAIGHYLTTHSFTILRGTLPRSEFPSASMQLNSLVPRNADRLYQVMVIHNQWSSPYLTPPLSEEVLITLAGFGYVTPRISNLVELDSTTDRNGMPNARVHFQYGAEDDAVIAQMAEGMRSVARTIGLTVEHPAGASDICLMPPGRDFHESGTCRMGNDPLTSVTDSYGQVHGFSNLYVADNSVLPNIGGANPTLSNVALSIRTADYIAAKQPDESSQ